MAIELVNKEFGRQGRIAASVAAEATPRPNGSDHRLTQGLGWFSVGLGMAQVMAPGAVARMIGANDTPQSRVILRAAGVREIATGMGLLARNHPKGWVKARIGGDMMDLALLGLAFSADAARPGRLAAATAAVAGVTALDLVVSRGQVEGEREFERVVKAITVNRPVEEVYRFWRGFDRLPQFMRHLESVRSLGSTRSHWTARGPAGTTVEWDAETVEDVTNDRIAWRSLPGADVENRGVVRFTPAPGGRGTEVIVELEYSPPGGTVGRALATVLGEEPEQQLKDDLRRFKQVLETGEIARTEASESLMGMAKPARPAHATPYREFARGNR
jgi:uncharacterized membrane protein